MQLSERLERLEADAAAQELLALQAIAEHLAAAEDQRSLVEASTLGRIGTMQDRFHTAAVKMIKKMVNRADQHLSNAYSYIYTYGGAYPNDQQVITGLQTGDYLGTMGITPEGLSPPNPASEPIPEPNSPPPLCPPGFQWNGSKCVPLPDVLEPLKPDSPPPPSADPPPPSSPPPLPPVPPGGEGLPGYEYPPGYGNTDRWCPSSKQEGVTAYDLVVAAIVAGWTGNHEPTAQYPTDTQVRPQGWSGTKIHGDWVLPDFAGNCPIGLVNNGGTGTFFNACRFPVCVGPPSPPPPEPPPPEPPTPPPPPPGFCPPPPANPCGIDLTFNTPPLTQVDWEHCLDLEATLESTLNAPFSIGGLIGMATGSTPSGTITSQILQAILGDQVAVIPALVNRFSEWMSKVIRNGAEASPCDEAKLVPVAMMSGVWSFIQRWTACVPPALTGTLNQLQNLVCQYLMPSQAQTDAAFLAGEITKEVWECWTRLNGQVVRNQEKIVEISRTRPDALQLSNLMRREKITREQYLQSMRELGVIRHEDRDRIWDMTEAWPGLQDVIRFLVRDVADKDLVDKFAMDEDFEKKWQGLLIKYADGLGVPKELARYYWRAHWHIPSYTQLSEMLHRLRPGQVPKAVEVTKEDVKTALQQDDYLPYWIERLMAISYRPMGRIDARRAFELRAIKDDEMKELLRDQGYDEKGVDLMFRYFEKHREVNERKRSGLPTARTLITKYSRGEIPENEFNDLIEKISPTDEQAAEMIKSAKFERRTWLRTQQIKGVKKSFVYGLISESTAHDWLANIDVDPGAIENLLDAWKADMVQRGKLPSAAMLCKWRENGLITGAEQITALRRLGYDLGAAQRIARDCEAGILEKARRANEKALKEAQKAEEKAKKELEKLMTLREKCIKEGFYTPVPEEAAGLNGQSNPSPE